MSRKPKSYVHSQRLSEEEERALTSLKAGMSRAVGKQVSDRDVFVTGMGCLMSAATGAMVPVGTDGKPMNTAAFVSEMTSPEEKERLELIRSINTLDWQGVQMLITLVKTGLGEANGLIVVGDNGAPSFVIKNHSKPPLTEAFLKRAADAMAFQLRSEKKGAAQNIQALPAEEINMTGRIVGKGGDA